MTQAKHTPGPWLTTNAHIENGEWVIGIASEKQDGTIALVIGSKVLPGYAQEYIEATSNACLIAAAPELLEAAEAIANGFPYTGHITSKMADDLLAAIAKAKGGAA